MRVEFQTRILPDHYKIGNHRLAMEMITGMQVGSRPPIAFSHYTLSVGKESSTVIDLPSSIATRIEEFCQQHYVRGEDNFDCQSLVFHVMNWAGGTIKDRREVYITHKEVGPTDLKTGKPYGIFGDSTPKFSHFMIGISMRGYSLGIGGHNDLLIIARNVDLLRAYEGLRIVEIQSVKLL